MTYHADVVRQRAILWAYRPVFNRLSARVRRIIVSSHEYLASSTFLPQYRDKCTVIPFGVDLDSFHLESGEQEQVQQLRRRHGGRLVVFLGVLRYYKGLDVLVRALNTLLDDEMLRTSLGRAARQRVEREFTAERVVKDTLSIYDDVLAREREMWTA